MKVAIVTGASGGIGYSVTQKLISLGFFVVLISSKEDKLLQLQNEFGDKNTLACPIDISNINNLRHKIKNIIKQFNYRIDLLFNNAGILHHGTTVMDDDRLQEIINVNLSGAIIIAQEVAQVMIEQQSGYIINVSSISGKIGHIGLGLYNATKFGLLGFSESLYKELALHNVKVTAICPSFVATGMTNNAPFENNDMMLPEDIAITTEYLLKLGANACPSEIIIKCLPETKLQSIDEIKMFS